MILFWRTNMHILWQNLPEIIEQGLLQMYHCYFTVLYLGYVLLREDRYTRIGNSVDCNHVFLL